MENKKVPEEYNAVASLFASNGGRVLEVEVLPSSIVPPKPQLLLIEGACVGIPKKVLVKAFLAAIKIFHQSRSSIRAKDDALASSTIILMFDPEYLTAANFRKRRLLGIARESRDTLSTAVNQELIFLNTILTSPLHRQSKSPTLWFHRWWLLTRFLLPSLDQSATSDLLAAEIQAVLKSGERHANNYYAFQHARRIMSMLRGLDAPRRQQSLSSMIDPLLQWCLKHPSDVSAWNMVYYLLAHQSHSSKQNFAILQPVLSFVENTLWRREALQSFLKLLVNNAALLTEEERLAVQKLCQA